MGEAPFRLRGYTVEQLLGRGASGSVWRARATSSGDEVALKRIETLDEAAAVKAENEAALLTALDHPHLIRLHRFVRTPDSAVLVLDLADGGSLARLLSARGRLAPGEVITAVAPVAAALAYLHDEGVVHGDVSPANILFTCAGVALLADVGVARLTGDDRDAASTPAYVDPAVAAGSVPGPQSDVFMLAAVALHALTGAAPWTAETGAGALDRARTGRLDDLDARMREARVPTAMAAVLARALAADPARRGTAAEFALDLRHSGEPVAVELEAGTVQRRPSGPRHAARPASPSDLDGRRPTRARAHRREGRSATGRGRRDGGSAGTGPASARPDFERPALPPARPDSDASGGNRAPIDEGEGPHAGTGRFGGSRGPDDRADGAPELRVGSEPPTRMVAPRVRPRLPAAPPRPGWHRPGWPPGWWRLGPGPSRGDARRAGRRRAMGVVVVAALLAAGALVWVESRPGNPTRAPARGVSARVTTPSGATRTSGKTSGRHSSVAPAIRAASAAGQVGTPNATAAATLDRLDAGRARAFAARDPTLLARVYSSASLLRTDIALLRRIVPPGCTLAGVRTRYRDVRAVSSGRGMVVTATATLAPSHLVCGRRMRATAPGTRPTRLRVTLAATPGGLRIAGQRRTP